MSEKNIHARADSLPPRAAWNKGKLIGASRR
jgi:hypothetical protein